MSLEITLPTYKWFYGDFDKDESTRNTYTGSIGTDGKSGCLDKTIFNFKVFLDKVDDGGTLEFNVSWFYTYPWFSGRENSETVTKTFEDNGQDTIDEIREYLLSCSGEIKPAAT